jgi:hypothetical protein
VQDDRRPGISRRASLQLTGAAAALSFVATPSRSAVEQAEGISPDRRDQSFDQDWRFFRSDGEAPRRLRAS